MLSRVTELRGRGTNVEYNKDLDILVIKLKDVDSLDYAEQYGDLIIHFKDNEPVEIEILNASKLLKVVRGA